MSEKVYGLIESFIDSLEEKETKPSLVTGIPTGFARLDQLTSGLHNSNLITIAGVAGVGKTTLALNIARNAATESGKNVLILSLNESKEEITSKLLCAEARLDFSRIRSGFLSKDDWNRITNSAGCLSDAPIYLSEKFDVETILKSDIDLLIIDSFQRLNTGASIIPTQEHRSYEVANYLKDIARKKDIPVIVISSLNDWRIEERSNKRPMLSDSKYGYTCLADLSDLFITIYRDEMYNKDEHNPNRSTAEIEILKHRCGPTGVIVLAFLNYYTRFEDLAELLE